MALIRERLLWVGGEKFPVVVVIFTWAINPIPLISNTSTWEIKMNSATTKPIVFVVSPCWLVKSQSFGGKFSV